MPQKPLEVARVTIVAGDSLFRAGSALAQLNGVEKVNHNFLKLFTLLEKKREDEKMGITAKRFFVAAVDLNSDRQGGLLQKVKAAGDMERGNTVIDAVDYRDYYPETWATNIDERDKESAKDNIQNDEPRIKPSLSPRLNFVLGGIAAGIKNQALAEILIVAHHFELKDSLLELQRRGANVAIAFYRSLMSPRWERFGLYGEGSKIKFIDLGPSTKDITSLGHNIQPNLGNKEISAVSELF